MKTREEMKQERYAAWFNDQSGAFVNQNVITYPYLIIWNRVDAIKDRVVYHCPLCEQQKLHNAQMGFANVHASYGKPYSNGNEQQDLVCPICRGKGFIEIKPIELGVIE